MENDDQFSAKANGFLDALEDLCRRHGVMLSVSDYDGLQFWDLKDGDEPVHCNGMEDRTRKKQ